MGTTGTPQSPAKVREDLLAWSNYDKLDEHGNRKFCKVLASARGKGGFWILLETEYTVYRDNEPPEHRHYTTATFHMMSSGGGMTYYKSMDIDCHPYYYSCPKSWLSLIQPQDPGGEEWKERAAAHHTGVVKITPGLPFVINGTVYTVEKFMSGRTWIVHSPTGKQFRASTSKIRNALMA